MPADLAKLSGQFGYPAARFLGAGALVRHGVLRLVVQRRQSAQAGIPLFELLLGKRDLFHMLAQLRLDIPALVAQLSHFGLERGGALALGRDLCGEALVLAARAHELGLRVVQSAGTGRGPVFQFRVRVSQRRQFHTQTLRLVLAGAKLFRRLGQLKIGGFQSVARRVAFLDRGLELYRDVIEGLAQLDQRLLLKFELLREHRDPLLEQPHGLVALVAKQCQRGRQLRPRGIHDPELVVEPHGLLPQRRVLVLSAG